MEAKESDPVNGDVTIQVLPGVSTMVDEKLHVQISGLNAGQSVTICTGSQDRNDKFVSYAHYEADITGRVDLNKQCSLGGTYSGLESMGLFWSLKQAEGQRPGLRLMPRDVTKPCHMKVSVLDGHVTVDTLERVEGADCLAQIELRRHFLSEQTERIVIRQGRLRATLFVPKGNHSCPGVIDLYGTAAGCPEYRATLLASHGFATLALGYVMYEDLPKSLWGSLDLGYFEEAIEFLSNHSRVRPNQIGCIGISMGASLTAYLTAISSKVIAAVMINGPCFNIMPMYYGDHLYPSIIPDVGKLDLTAKDGIIWRDTGPQWQEEDPVPETHLVPIEKSTAASFLVICGEDDMSCFPENSRILVGRCLQHGSGKCQLLSYPGAGHLLEPPYMPFTWTSYNRGFNHLTLWGGIGPLHAAAQEDMWPKIIDFFHRNLMNSSKL